MDNFIMMPIPMHMFTSVCALLGSEFAEAAATGSVMVQSRAPAPEPARTAGDQEKQPKADPAPAGAADNVELDAGGHPWSADLHASTKTKTKEGYWRMKVGVSRPADKPGFPQGAGTSTGATGTPSGGAPAQAGGSVNGPNAGPATPDEDEDEFAAFRAAAAKADATDKDAAASVPARQWSDTDLGALCNQAAQKLGDPAPIRDIITKYVPDGQVVHSRNVPADKRADFAQAVEQKAGITFAG